MPPITIYTTQTCPYCHLAKRLLQNHGLEFSEIDVTGNPELRKTMRNKASGENTVPQIWIGDDHIGGCDDLRRLEKNGGLLNLTD